MSQGSLTNISALRIGNYVTYGGHLQSVKDQIGVIVAIDELEAPNSGLNFSICFGADTSKTIMAKEREVGPIPLGVIKVDEKLLENFGFAPGMQPGFFELDPIGIVFVKLYDTQNMLLGYGIRAYQLGDDPSNPKTMYSSVSAIHEIQNYSQDKYDRDLIGERQPSVLGKKYSASAQNGLM